MALVHTAAPQDENTGAQSENLCTSGNVLTFDDAVLLVEGRWASPRFDRQPTSQNCV